MSKGDLHATFVVRLRRERGTPVGDWRGEVEHVQSARVTRFADGVALSTFVWSQLAELEASPSTEAGEAEPATTDRSIA